MHRAERVRIGAPPADDVFAAIANPVRRALLEALRDGPRAVHELAEGFAISRPAVSQHLATLRSAQLVVDVASGRERRYQLEPSPLRVVHAWAGHYELFWSQRLAALRDVLEAGP